MKARNFLMVVSALSIAGCSQNEVTEMRQDTNPVLGFNVYTGVPTRGYGRFDYNNAKVRVTPRISADSALWAIIPAAKHGIPPKEMWHPLSCITKR